MHSYFLFVHSCYNHYVSSNNQQIGNQSIFLTGSVRWMLKQVKIKRGRTRIMFYIIFFFLKFKIKKPIFIQHSNLVSSSFTLFLSPGISPATRSLNNTRSPAWKQHIEAVKWWENQGGVVDLEGLLRWWWDVGISVGARGD